MLERYTYEGLSQQTGVPVRRIRGWIQQGLIPHGDPKGKYGAYTIHHVRAIRAILDLKDANMTNADIRDRLNPIGFDDD